jgi:hypothetical protein
MTEPSWTLLATNVTYYSTLDEDAFFGWLDRVGCVAGYEGKGVDLAITLKRAPDDDELRELIGLFHRYGVDMRPLAVFSAAPGRDWFTAPQMFWHRKIFGASR